MWKRLFFLPVLLFSLASARTAAQPDQWYLISEAELRQFETALTNWERDRQTWLSQVRILSADSASLNKLLKQERELTLSLKKSYSEFEAGQFLLMSQKDTELAAQRLKTKGVENQRNILAVIIGSTALLIGGYVVMKLKKVV